MKIVLKIQNPEQLSKRQVRAICRDVSQVLASKANHKSILLYNAICDVLTDVGVITPGTQFNEEEVHLEY